ncbi:hypothetical protein DIU31_023655 [Mucilaginibacter rubeus]|uniref:Tetratricopeptide repeat protein n=1 Tax=Mucilaginibacter rubeus TaxID=2027860 RepID=A0AAE6MK53_9SPHI|nr:MULTISPECIES: hypothetical protein [Mucilaginibacter]QEM06366.1 hypothetical protein DIU31_023655 [Mucilaginibacter rubeus]QEM18949.1 hypothetical protein DIU38_023885 [Mucilaginibacter gossypii]QTE44509.1 hypothetical protein J3L19_03825 [Mucilaginibacter rubeus]QTE51107.1 hypothetical protein J3L21_03800 [Mucilaginibacter rubeus]QTE56193.1 hypothetical protein J3L23_29050 [Mucilaginibacter rubeus]
MNWPISTFQNLTRKPLRKFLLVFSLCTLTIAGVIWACADSDDSDYSVFAPEYFVNKQYSPFFYSSYEIYYGQGYAESSNTRYNDIIVNEWDAHFNHQFSAASLKFLLLKATPGQVDSAYRKFTGALKTLPAKYPPINTGTISHKMLAAFYNYLKLAKSCESYTVNNEDYVWEKVTPKQASVNLEATLFNAYNKETDPFIKERLWFQTVRYYYFAGGSLNAKIVKAFEQFKTHFPKNLTWYRAWGYVAGYHYQQKNYALSNYLYSLCYDYTYKLKIPSFWSFHPQNETDWQATLKLAKTVDEKITLWHLLGAQYDEGRAIKEIVAINPKSEKLDLLLSRLINIREAGTVSIETPPVDSARKSRVNNRRLVESIALKNNTAKPYYWNLAAGYLNFLDSNYTAAGKFYTAARKQLPAGDKMLTAQSKLLDILLYVKTLKKIDATAEARLVEPLNWLANLRDDKIEITDLRFKNAVTDCTFAISKLYKKQGNLIKQLCFDNNYHEFYNDSTNVSSLINLLNKPVKTPFEQAMLRYYPVEVNDLYYHQAVMLTYRQETQKAITWIKKMKPDTTTFPGNPFNGRLVDCHDCDHAAPQKQKFTTMSFLQTLNAMETEIKDGKSIYRNAYLVANAYYNITYYGNARAFYEGDPVMPGAWSRYYYEDEEKMNEKLTSMRIAIIYYELARKNAATDEQRARCTFMLSKCALNEIYNDPEFKGADKFADIKASQPVTNAYYKYFAQLKEKYNNTAYYKEALKECGYFRIYADKK